MSPSSSLPSSSRSRAAAELSTPPLMATAVVCIIDTSIGILLKIYWKYTTFFPFWQPEPLERLDYNILYSFPEKQKRYYKIL